MFLWRTVHNNPLIIIKYPSYLFHWWWRHTCQDRAQGWNPSFPSLQSRFDSWYMYWHVAEYWSAIPASEKPFCDDLCGSMCSLCNQSKINSHSLRKPSRSKHSVSIGAHDLKYRFTKWARTRQNQQNDPCVQRRLRSAWASTWVISLCVCLIPRILHADSKDSDKTGRMPRLVWVFTGCTGNFVGFVVLWLKYEHCL